MSDHKFKAGDVVKVRSGSEPMTVIEYDVSHAGAVYNAFQRSGEKKYQDSVETGKVLCEWMFKGKHSSGLFEESSLELIKSVDS